MIRLTKTNFTAAGKLECKNSRLNRFRRVVSDVSFFVGNPI